MARQKLLTKPLPPRRDMFDMGHAPRKPGQCCGLCDCYTPAGRCSWGFKLKRKPDDWCFQFGSRKLADELYRKYHTIGTTGGEAGESK